MPPLPHAHYQPLPLREIRPAGWLQDFLQRQATGLTGHVEVSGYPYGYKFWGSQTDDIKGSYGTWWPYEQTAYWIDGALKCGYLAGDDALYHKALEEIDFALEHADPDGFIGPEHMRDKDRWPHAVFFRAVLAQYEITDDPRYLQALVRHYRALPHPMGWDRDVTGVEILLHLYQSTGDETLLALAQDLYTRFNAQFPDHDCALGPLLSDRVQTEHGVTYNELAKLAAHLYCATGNEEYLRAVRNGYAKLDRDSLLPDGLHSCSEHLKGKTSRDMHETCDLTDHTWALYYLFQATGDPHLADRIERILFNALPGAITKDFRALQYFSCPNQVVADSTSSHNVFMRGLNWMAYRPDHEVQCCPGNVHRTMPNYLSRMWMKSKDGTLTAVLYGPGILNTTVGNDAVPLTLTTQTRYPFQESLTFTFSLPRPTVFPLALRLPAWCADPRLTLNGAPLQAELTPGTFHTLTREWHDGDQLTLELPYTLALEHWPRGGISLTYGPLTLAYPVPTRAEIETENSTVQQIKDTMREHYQPRAIVTDPAFPAWNLTPTGPWNYALAINETTLDDLRVEWNDTCPDPLDATNPALKVYVPARRVRHWHLLHTHKLKQWGHWMENDVFTRGYRTIEGDFRFTPALPDPTTLPPKLSSETEEIALIPYGATMLRISVFPQG